MTKEQTIELANRAGVMPCYIGDSTAIERFAKLVRNAALEECAVLCASNFTNCYDSNITRQECAGAIRNLKEPTP